MMDRWGTFNTMFEFNHVDPTKKHPEYDNLIRREISSDQLDEVDKCVLLCVLCHKILHAQNISGSLHLTVNAAGKQATQILKGQVMADNKTNEARFLTNERVLVVPYRVKPGSQQPQICFGTELEREGLLEQHLRDLPRIKTLTVMGYKSSHIWMRARHIEGLRIELEQDIRFPVLQAELCGDSEDDPFVWVRNGFALTKKGEVIDHGTVRAKAFLATA